MAPASPDIRVYVSNGNGFVFTAEEVYTLRAKYSVTGTLIGTLPSASQQNVFLGLPLLLLPEEVVLLVGKGMSGVVMLVDDIVAHAVLPSFDRLAKWHESSRGDIQAAIGSDRAGLNKLSKDKARSAPRADVVSAKRAEREAKRAALTAPAALSITVSQTSRNGDSTDELTSSAEISLFTPDQPSSSICSGTEGAPASPSSSIVKPHSVTVPTTSSVLPWYPTSAKPSAFAAASPITASLLQHQHEYETLEAARQAGLWTYPSTQEERARCAVFRDLHEKGYWMGGGLKFGGDWLVYPGDPLRYHSHFVATVYPTPTSTLRPMEIVALGRLGTGTKKSHLLCGWDEATGNVDYYSIEWAGFG